PVAASSRSTTPHVTTGDRLDSRRPSARRPRALRWDAEGSPSEQRVDLLRIDVLAVLQALDHRAQPSSPEDELLLWPALGTARRLAELLRALLQGRDLGLRLPSTRLGTGQLDRRAESDRGEQNRLHWLHGSSPLF